MNWKTSRENQILILNFQVRAVAVSSTEVRLSWKAPKADEQNGDLLGYKIFYYATHINGQAGLEETEVIVRHPDYNIAALENKVPFG